MTDGIPSRNTEFYRTKSRPSSLGFSHLQSFRHCGLSNSAGRDSPVYGGLVSSDPDLYLLDVISTPKKMSPDITICSLWIK